MSFPQRLSRPLAARIAALPVASAWPAESAAEPPEVIEAAVSALRHGHTHYTDSAGILPLREYAASSLRSRYGIDLTPEDVIITCGATEARYLAIKGLAKPGQQVYIPGPALISGAVAIAGAEITTVPSDKVSLVYLTPDDDPSAVGAVLAQATQHGWYILWDLAAASSVGRANAFHPVQLSGIDARTVTVESASERLPGWRVGWLAGSDAIGRFREIKECLTTCTTSYAQWAALEAAKHL